MPKITITVTETVVYEIDVEVPDGSDDDTIAALAEEYWCHHGDPIANFVSVEDRTFDWE